MFGTCSFQKLAMCFTCLRVWDLFRPLLDQLVPVFGVFDVFDVFRHFGLGDPPPFLAKLVKEISFF